LTTEPEHIRRAKRLISEAIQRTNESGKPTGVTTLADIQRCEAALAYAQEDLAEYTRSDAHMHETVDAEGRKGLAVGSLRADMLEHKRDRVTKRRDELKAIKRQWLSGIEE